MPQKGERIENLDAIRGLAALSVMLFHFSSLPQLWELPVFSEAKSWGWAGVDAFFVLSGYVVPMALWQSSTPQAPRVFLSRRMCRLAGPFWLAAVLSIGMSWLSATLPGYRGSGFDVPTLPVVACHLLYACDLVDIPWVNPAFWTLSIEVQFYLLVAALSLVVATPRGRLVAVAVIAILLALVPFAPTLSLIPFMPLFVLGFSAFLWQRSALSRSLIVVIWTVLLVEIVLMSGLTEFFVAGCTLALILRPSRPAHLGRPLVWLGGISYSLYLLHIPIGSRMMNLGDRWDVQGLGLYGMLLAACLASVAAAWVFWRVVEVPCLRLSRRIRAAPMILPSAQPSLGRLA